MGPAVKSTAPLKESTTDADGGSVREGPMGQTGRAPKGGGVVSPLCPWCAWARASPCRVRGRAVACCGRAGQAVGERDDNRESGPKDDFRPDEGTVGDGASATKPGGSAGGSPPPQWIASRYRLTRELGAGGFGAVHLARDETLGRDVAVKLLYGHVDRERFAREARALARLRHRHVVAVHDFGTDGDRDYLVLEHVDGPPLSELLAEGPLRWSECVRITAEVASALAHAADHGVLHRDIKPSNVLLAEDRRAKVVDFGIARIVDEASLTATGHVVGTVPYMAPEMLDRGLHDERSEIWSLGVLLYEALAGRRPFQSESNERLVTAILRDEAPPLPDEVELPERLGELVSSCLAKDPDARPASVATLERSLRALLPREDADGDAGPIPERLRVHSAVAPPPGERRRVALLWIEERHLDALSERLSESEAESARGRLLLPVLRAVEERGGLVADLEHDGLLAVFGLPRVREADARLALEAAKEIAALDGAQSEAGVAASFAAAAETCGVEAGPDGVPRFRRADRRALRELASGLGAGESAPGEQLASALAGRQGGEGRRTRDRLGQAPAPLLGREAELAILRETARTAFAGRGLVATIQGEAGLGKSRLFEQILTELAAVAEAPLLLRARAPETGHAAPGELARRLGVELTERVELGDSLDAAERTRLTRPLGTDTDLSAREREEALGSAWARALRVLAHRGPTLIAIEDLHDGDAASLRLLERIAESASRLPVLLLATHRPGPQPRWIGRPFHRPLTLGPLDAAAQLALLELELPDESDTQAHRLVELADGNPFFLIELARDRRDRGTGDLKLPASVSAVLGERLDRLPRAQRELLQVGAILGREFPLSAACALSGLSPAEARDRAERLIVGDHLFEGFTWDEPGFSFPHALLREAALDSLSAAAARELHGRAAAGVEAAPEGPLAATPERLAYHWSRSDETSRALPHLDAAAKRASAAGNLTDAVELARRAVEIAEASGDELSLMTARLCFAELIAVMGDVQEGADIAAGVADSATDPRQQLRARLVQAHCAGFGSDVESRLAVLDDAHPLADSLADQATLAELHALRGEALLSLGRDEEAAAAFELLAAAAPGHPQRELDVYKLGALLAWRRNDMAAALQHAESGLTRARELGERLRAVRFLSQRATVAHETGPVPRAMEAANECLEEARSVGLPATEAYALSLIASLGVRSGRPKDAEAAARRGLEVASDLGHDQRRMVALVVLAETLLEQDRLEEARRQLEEAAALATSLSSPAWERDVRALDCRLLLAEGDDNGAGLAATELLALSDAASDEKRALWATLALTEVATPEQACRMADDAVGRATGLDEPELLIVLLLGGARAHLRAHDDTTAAGLARQAAELAEKNGFDGPHLVARALEALARGSEPGPAVQALKDSGLHLQARRIGEEPRSGSG